MGERVKAIAFRERVLPDSKVGSTSTNKAIRRAHVKAAVCERACMILRAVVEGVDAEAVDQMCAMAYLAGTLDLTHEDIGKITEATLREEGFSDFVVVGARKVTGLDFDTTYHYYRELLAGFDDFKLVKGALHIAEMEALAAAPDSAHVTMIRNHVHGHVEPWVRPLLMTVPRNGYRMIVLLDAAMAGR